MERKAGMIIEYDVAVPMRDGAIIYADVFRPEAPGQYPPLIGWGSWSMRRGRKEETGLLSDCFGRQNSTLPPARRISTTQPRGDLIGRSCVRS